MATCDCFWPVKKNSTRDGFPLKYEVGQSILRNLKTIPFLSRAIKTCIQLYKEFPDLRGRIWCQIFLLPVRMAWPGK